MSDINERYAEREKLPSWAQLFKNKGDSSTAQIMTDPVEVQTHRFNMGMKGEPLFWQNKKPVVESELDRSLPFTKVLQWAFEVQLKDGTRYMAYFDKEKKNALVAAIKSGTRCLKGGIIKMTLTDLDEKMSIPKKFYEIQLKEPKES